MKKIARTILYILGIAIVAVLLASCCPCKKLGTDTTQKDSVRVETHEIIVEKIDTAYVEIPVEVVRNVTRDTCSTVETSLATSTAIIMDGFLFHDITNKSGQLPVQVVTKEVIRDTTVYKDRYISKDNRVEVPRPLTAWQRFQMTGFWVMLAGVVAMIAVLIVMKREL